jgi:hypothetical protein
VKTITTPPISDSLDRLISLWGLSCLSMLNYYLPDGGRRFGKVVRSFPHEDRYFFFAAPTLGASVGEAGSTVLRSRALALA